MLWWSWYYTHTYQSWNGYLSQVTKKINRRTVPFVQAMEDVRYLAVQERNYMILKAVCDSEAPELFDTLRARYQQEDFFVSYYRATTGKANGDGRPSGSRFF